MLLYCCCYVNDYKLHNEIKQCENVFIKNCNTEIKDMELNFYNNNDKRLFLLLNLIIAPIFDDCANFRQNNV